MQTLLLSIILIALAVAGIGIKIVVKTTEDFPVLAAVIIRYYTTRKAVVVFVEQTPRKNVNLSAIKKGIGENS